VITRAVVVEEIYRALRERQEYRERLIERVIACRRRLVSPYNEHLVDLDFVEALTNVVAGPGEHLEAMIALIEARWCTP
jgi:hypothetical protein